MAKHLDRVATVLALALALTGGDALAAPPRVDPLPAASRRVLMAIPTDPPPKKLVSNQHYLVSDERHPDYFREGMRDLGGIFVGVGAEQNYLFASWVRPEVLVLLDFDQAVVDLHAVYAAFFSYADSFQRFHDLWSPGGTHSALARIAEHAKDKRQLEGMRHAFLTARAMVHARLYQLRSLFRVRGLPSFASDSAEYRYVRQLVRSGRVRAVRGDLTGQNSMAGLVAASKRLGIPIRGVYVSNVEHYFDYGTNIDENILAVSTDPKALIIRTTVTFKKAERYRYVFQSGADFRSWIDTKNVRRVEEMVQKAWPNRTAIGGAFQMGPASN